VARLKCAVLISGRGSNLQALLEACAEPAFPAEIVAVVSNRADAGGLERASAAGIATRVIDHREYEGRDAFDAALDSVLREMGSEFICLAGFMRLLGSAFVAAWSDRILNIHPSLLPAFKGLDSHEQALAAGVRLSGCTVHFVRAELDDGPIVVQAVVPIHPDDNAERLAARVLEAEHRCYPLALRLVAEGRARIDGARVVLDDAPGAKGVMINPESG
jgi:phosphoribosylglycinamide formyltransferase-1